MLSNTARHSSQSTRRCRRPALEGRTYNGVNYAKFNARLTKVTSSGVTLDVLDVAGSPITPITIKPAESKALILVNGQQPRGESNFVALPKRC